MTGRRQGSLAPLGIKNNLEGGRAPSLCSGFKTTWSWRRGVRVKRGKNAMFSGDGFVKMAGFQLLRRTISLLIPDE
jgi:hypothetical protein